MMLPPVMTRRAIRRPSRRILRKTDRERLARAERKLQNFVALMLLLLPIAHLLQCSLHRVDLPAHFIQLPRL